MDAIDKQNTIFLAPRRFCFLFFTYIKLKILSSRNDKVLIHWPSQMNIYKGYNDNDVHTFFMISVS